MREQAGSRFFEGGASEAGAWLRDEAVETVRVDISDLTGIARGKAMPVRHFERVLEHGMPLAAAALSLDAEATVVPGTIYGETTGFADLVARPDLSSLRVLRHEPATALVLCDAFWPDGRPVQAHPRQVLARAVERLSQLGLRAQAAPELEFYILDDQYRLIGPGVQAYSMLHRHAFLAEERVLLDAASAHGEIEASGHEYGPGQYEVSIRYQEIRKAADFGHLFRSTLKEAARSIDRRVTFMAQPYESQSGCSCHVHLSLVDGNGANAFAAPGEPDGLSALCRHFIGGVLEHLDELVAVFLPNANSYRRIVPGAFAPFSRAWGIDNRTAAIRVLNDEPANTRTELRICGGDVNLYLGFAALLAAGTDGIRKQTDPGPPAKGDLDVQNLERVPRNWGAALDAFDASEWVRDALGEEFCHTYGLVKRFEYEKSRRTVSDTERKLYMEVL